MHTVELDAPIIMVPSKNLEADLRAARRDSPLLPADPGAIAKRLNDLNGPRGLPATVPPPRPGRDWSWVVYTPGYKIGFFLIPKSGAFRIAFVKPLDPRDRQELATSSFTVRATEWRTVRTDSGLPPIRRSDKAIRDAWKGLEQAKAKRLRRSPLSPEQHAYLNTLDDIIDAAESIARRKAANAPATAYRAKRSTGEQRHGRRSVYLFDLVGPNRLEAGMFVDLARGGDLRGQISRIEAMTATIRFDQPIDWDAIPAVGQIREAPSDIVYRSERKAVAMLRSRKARNPHLLDTIVDARARKIPETHIEPARPLNPEQRQAFQKALTVEDLLVVHGPPGTGKTRTISEITGAAVLDLNQKVLIASHSNRAVDNVLTGLPDDLEVLRVGHRDSITPDGLPFLLEERVAELRTRIRAATEQAIGPYRELDAAEAWTRAFAEKVDDFEAAATALAAARAEAERAAASAAAPFRLDLADLDRRHRASAAAFEQRRSDEHRWLARTDRLRNRTGIPVLGLWFAFVLKAIAPAVSLAANRRLRAEQQRDVAAATANMLRKDLERAVTEDPGHRRAREGVDATELRLRTAYRAVTATGRDLASAFRGLLSLQLPDGDAAEKHPAAALETLRHQHAHLLGRLPMLKYRKGLLERWHTEVVSATDQLGGEFVRYADVIAATCIGSASRSEITGIDFDLAIIDEAGQIGVNDTLVPLTRARRGVLVGDAQQLPPFLDSEVGEWGAAVGDPQIRGLLSKSALEILSDRIPDANQVALAEQRRMPEAISAFVSAQFYGSRLRTVHAGASRDPLLPTPMTFVDTSALPQRQRFERRHRGAEGALPGFVNDTEAALLARIAAFYARQPGGLEWGVIVPYRAQLGRVKALLRDHVAETRLVEQNVGTVDAFQGGERDVVLYGFTRSNANGQVGFLSELRRLNVAFTRARSRLVMIGDLTTLTAARNEGFRRLADDLVTHLATRGEIRSCTDVQLLLDAAEAKGNR